MLEKLLVIGERLLPSRQNIICADSNAREKLVIGSNERIQRNIFADLHTLSVEILLHQYNVPVIGFRIKP